MRRFRPVLVMLVIAAAVASWWLRDSTAPPSAQSVRKEGPREIDYYITGFDITQMTEAGRPAHRLVAARAHHFTDDDTTELQQPRLTVYQLDSPPWQVDADGALVSSDGSLILLSGEVAIERAGGSNSRPVRMTTRNLRVQPKQDYAETDEKVRVETDRDWLDATGMQAWFRPPSRLKFLSQVKGYYVPDAAIEN